MSDARRRELMETATALDGRPYGRAPENYTPAQRRAYTQTFDDLIGLGMHEAAADNSARNKAEGTNVVKAAKIARYDDALVTVPQGETAADLLERPMQAITFNNDPWIPEGLGITAGRPKLGKSTLIRQKLAAVAAGDEFFGTACRQAKCAFLSLEENDRQTRHKLELARFSRDALSNLILFFNWKRGADGVRQLARLLDEDESIGYIAIDSLTRFRAVPDARTPAFSADYEAVTALQALCKSRPGVTIECIHHTRKAKSDDPLDDISGTYGLSAACDWYSVMRHHEDGAVLHVGGRLWDREQNQYQLRQANQRWELVGEFNGLSQLMQDTLAHLQRSGGGGPRDVAKFWGIAPSTAADRLAALVKHGVAYSSRGIYYAK
jgi:hypothetical protein